MSGMYWKKYCTPERQGPAAPHRQSGAATFFLAYVDLFVLCDRNAGNMDENNHDRGQGQYRQHCMIIVAHKKHAVQCQFRPTLACARSACFHLDHGDRPQKIHLVVGKEVSLWIDLHFSRQRRAMLSHAPDLKRQDQSFHHLRRSRVSHQSAQLSLGGFRHVRRQSSLWHQPPRVRPQGP